DDRQTSDEFRDQPEFEQIFGHQLLQQPADLLLLARFGHRAEAERVRSDARFDDLLEAVKSAAADEQDVGRVDLDELLMRMLAPALRRYVGCRPFENLE